MWIPVVMAAVLAAAPAATQAPKSVDASLVPNYAVLGPGLAAGGQPTAEGLKRLKELGFKTVVNLRTDAEPGVAEEAAQLAGEGLAYHHVPVSPASFSAADVAAVKAVLDDPAAAPVLLHCSSSNRVGAVWAVLQAQQGKGLEEAEAEGRRAGLKSESMLEAARRLIRESGH